MGLDEVKQEIQETADRQAERISGEGKSEAAMILRAADERISQIRASAQEGTLQIIDEMRRREISGAELELRNRSLEQKKALIEQVLLQAADNLAKLDAKKRQAFHKTLIARAKKDLDIAVVLCSAKDKPAISRRVRAKVIETDISGGVIVENKSGTVRIDYSFETVLSDLKEKHLGTIGKMLFG